jgi:hypothetical protein
MWRFKSFMVCHTANRPEALPSKTSLWEPQILQLKFGHEEDISKCTRISKIYLKSVVNFKIYAYDIADTGGRAV